MEYSDHIHGTAVSSRRCRCWSLRINMKHSDNFAKRI